jgi:uncharacterized iron-regulated membrane protein
MILERKVKIAIAAALFWMAFATVVILGTHGEAVAKADTVAPAGEPASTWMAQPASEMPHTEMLAPTRPC